VACALKCRAVRLNVLCARCGQGLRQGDQGAKHFGSHRHFLGTRLTHTCASAPGPAMGIWGSAHGAYLRCGNGPDTASGSWTRDLSENFHGARALQKEVLSESCCYTKLRS